MHQLKAYRDLSFRIALIAIASVVLLYLTQKVSYDPQLVIRKKQPIFDKLIIIEIPTKREVQSLITKLRNLEVSRVIIPATAFTESLGEDKLFTYSTSLSKSLDQNIPLRLQLDSDGNVRRFSIRETESAKKVFENFDFSEQYLINFRGPKDTFQKMSYQDISDEMASFFNGKSVILSIKNLEEQMVTPLGIMEQSEILANVLDNYFQDRFIRRVSMTEQLIICSIILFASLILLIYLPTSLALASSILLIIFYTSLSLALFDRLYIWTPLLTPILQIFITYILISNYKLILNERTRWRLEKESHFLSEVEEMKTNFLSLFSHDLKTPLAKILASIETQLSQPHIDEKQKAELLKIKAYCSEIERYFKRILKTAQVESKKISIDKKPTDTNKLIEKVVNKFKPAAQDKDVKIKTELSPLFLIEMDETLVQEVLFNFIENALSYSPKGGTITIRSEESKNYIKVAVVDQGPGIPMEVQDKVWEKFYRLESRSQGYGLGLYLSKYVIELHRGQVYLKTKKEKGSEFGFHLPIEEGL